MSHGNLKTAIEKAKKALESDNVDEIKTASEELTAASHKLAEAMYAKASQQQGTEGAAGPGPDAASGGQTGDSSASNDGEDVVDADFEEVK